MEFIKKNKNILILLFLALICLLFSMGHYANIIIDVGREVYYPVEILNGKVLYKDLFCIYGPSAYLLNAFAFKLFGIKLSVVLTLGLITALSTIFLTYKISRRFLSEFYSCSIVFYMIMTGCLATRIFNFTLPYSYAILYGLLCFLISIYFLIKFQYEKNLKTLYVASFFAGFTVSFKYDFILFVLPLIFIILKTKDIKTILKTAALAAFGLVFPFIVLFIQGLNIQNLIASIQTIKAFTFTTALKTFYVTQGVYYTNRVWVEWLGEILVLAIYFLFIYFGLHLLSRKPAAFKLFGIILAVFGFNLAYTNADADSYLFLTFFTTVLFIIFFKKNSNTEKLFIISSILISLKSFWGLSHVNYGLYFAPLVLISLFTVLKNVFAKKITNSICILLIGMSLQYGVGNYFGVRAANFPIKSTKGTIYTMKDMGAPSAEIVEFVNNLKEENPSVMVFPEGLMLNFLSNKKTITNGLYNSLIPLYTEGFGEDIIIKNYKENPVDYIIFSNILSDSYRKGEICKTYAYDVCHYIYQNYSKVFETKNKGEYNYIVFKRN